MYKESICITMTKEKEIFKRAELLMGEDVMEALASKRVIVFGVGGVGSWCVECLVRSGIRHITIVDCDCVCASNVNRQLMGYVLYNRTSEGGGAARTSARDKPRL